jgi:hypothetical protein
MEGEGPADILFQQDRAQAHFHKEVTEFLNQKFPEKWIGRDRSITWPPYSPYPTPFDFFFCGDIRDAVYMLQLATTSLELAGRVRDVLATVTLD